MQPTAIHPPQRHVRTMGPDWVPRCRLQGCEVTIGHGEVDRLPKTGDVEARIPRTDRGLASQQNRLETGPTASGRHCELLSRRRERSVSMMLGTGTIGSLVNWANWPSWPIPLKNSVCGRVFGAALNRR